MDLQYIEEIINNYIEADTEENRVKFLLMIKNFITYEKTTIDDLPF